MSKFWDIGGMLRRAFSGSGESFGEWATGGGGVSESGVKVTASNMLTVTAVLQGIRLISETLAMMSLITYETGAKGERNRAVNHPLYALLKVSPNPYQTAFEFVRMMFAMRIIWGTSFAHIKRDAGGRVVELWPIPSYYMKPETRAGRPVWLYENQKEGVSKYIPWDEVLVDTQFTTSGRTGLGLVHIGRESIGQTMALDRFAQRVWKKGLLGGLILRHPGKLDKEAQKKLQEDLRAQVGGLDKAHLALVLKEGMEAVQVGVDPEKAQVMDGRTFQVGEVARLLNIPPHLLMELSNATFSNIEHQGIQFLLYTLAPYMKSFEQRVALHLLTPEERGRIYVEFNSAALLRPDMKTRAEVYQILVGGPIMSINEARDRENLPPVEGGDVIMMPLNMGQVGQSQPGADGEAPAQDGDDDTRGVDSGQLTVDSEYRNAGRDGYVSRSAWLTLREENVEHTAIRATYAGLIADGAEKVVKAEAKTVAELGVKHLISSDHDAFRRALALFYEGPEYARLYEKHLKSIFARYAEAMVGVIGREIGEKEIVVAIDGYLSAYSDALVSRSAGAHNNQLLYWLDGLDRDADIQSELDRFLGDWRDKWPDKVGSNEAVRLGEGVARKVYEEAGLTKVVWVNNAGACPLCQRLDGKVVGVTGSFLDNGDVVEPEDGDENTQPLTTYSTVFHPPLHRGCGCRVRAA